MKKRTPNIDAVEIAQKQRHLYLLSQVKNARHLSRAELKELDQLEKMAKRKTKGERRKTSKSAQIAAGQILRTQREAATYASCSARTIRRWIAEGMLTAQVAGKMVYIKSQLDFFKRAEGKIPTEAKTKGQTADARYKHAKADLMEIELEEKQGEIDKRAEAAMIPKLLVLRRGLLSLPKKIASGMPPEYKRLAHKISMREVRYLMKSLANK